MNVICTSDYQLSNYYNYITLIVHNLFSPSSNEHVKFHLPSEGEVKTPRNIVEHDMYHFKSIGDLYLSGTSLGATPTSDVIKTCV